MLRGFFLGIVFSVVVALGGAYLTIVSGWIPANANAKLGWLEKHVASASLRATLAAEAPRQANPVAATDADLIEGVRLYGEHCAICHGSATGDTSASAIAKGEYPAPPQLAKDGVEDDPEGWTFWKIQHGIRWTGMPSWKDELGDKQIWTLALFLKHMNKLPPQAEAAWKALPQPTTAAPTSAPASPAGRG